MENYYKERNDDLNNDIIETITILKNYALNIQGKAMVGNVETIANIAYTITKPGCEPITGTLTSGSLTGSYPTGTTVSITVSKTNFTSTTKNYTMTSAGITDTITSLGFTVSLPAIYSSTT